MFVIDSYYTTKKGLVNADFVPFAKVVNTSKKPYNMSINTNKRS